MLSVPSSDRVRFHFRSSLIILHLAVAGFNNDGNADRVFAGS